MKKILGLDLGVGSIGWALVNEAQEENEKSGIVRLGVRVNPLTVDEQQNFDKGKPITTTADRTLKRSMRRNLQRFKLRRDNLIDVLKKNNFITDEEILSENGNATTFQTWRLRARAAKERIELNELARVLLMINKKRGYKSSRKANSSEEGELIDGIAIAKRMYDEGITPGEVAYEILKSGKRYVPSFYRSDLRNEFEKVWSVQSEFYPEILTDDFKEKLEGKAKTLTSKIFLAVRRIYLAENKEKDRKLKAYEWRARAVKEQLEIGEVAYVLAEINGDLSNSSGYLGAISDRSKELYFNNQTVGQYLMAELDKDPHFSLKNKVFYRQDYMDEFEKIWECQKQFHKELTDELKHEIRDITIFYQRQLKSQKGLISFCELESREVMREVDGVMKKKISGCKVAPRSSFVFQEFKIWQVLNNIEIKSKEGKRALYEEEKERLSGELKYRDKMTKPDILKLLFKNYRELDMNYKEVEGDRTMARLYSEYMKIAEMMGYEPLDVKKVGAEKVREMLKEVFEAAGVNTSILEYNAELDGKEYEAQPIFRLWHLLYSFESDNTPTGDGKLVDKIVAITGLDREYAKLLAKTTFQNDYGSLSAKAMRKILPFMKQGLEYSEACAMAGYRHSKASLTKEEIENRVYKERLEILPKNSLRNPVVEKIVNQMIHVVNGVAEEYGKPDEIRIELARELKNSADERDRATRDIAAATRLHEDIKKKLHDEFGLSYVSRTDIIRYKLYEELAPRGYKTLYTDTYIPREKLFSKEFDIEHIIPQAKLFNDSFANKTLESRSANIEKADKTAYDYVLDKYGEEGIERYKKAIDTLNISNGKKKNLLCREADIPKDFIQRDLRDTQYISKKAREILLEMVPVVTATTGSITDRLREDWQLINVMQELNWDKYDKQGMTYFEENRDGKRLPRIKDWTKRNDHRHHAMDALTIAFTKPSYIQYINNLNARSDKAGSIYGIEQKELYRSREGKLLFKSPMPLNEFRMEAKRQLQNILISIKAKNKVTTRQTNISKRKGGVNRKVELTPRGMLHKETVYGKSQEYVTTWVKIGSKTTKDVIAQVANAKEKAALLMRLLEFDGDPKKAFSGKNSPEKNPIWLNDQHSEKLGDKVKLVTLEDRFTIRKAVAPDLKLEKVVDVGIRRILQARLDEFGGNAKEAFSNLDENPIWLNKENGIQIKRVVISGVSNAVALHDKKNKDGVVVNDADGNKIGVDYVSTGSNHHVAIYEDEKGELQEVVVSVFEATQRKIEGLPIIDKGYNADKGWKFLFTMKQNEYFVFPRYETKVNAEGKEESVCVFDPKDIDLMNRDNYAVISQNLYRVQKFTIKDYFFRHHLETNVEDVKELKGLTWKRTGLADIKGIVKVRVNHLGEIVQVGEY